MKEHQTSSPPQGEASIHGWPSLAVPAGAGHNRQLIVDAPSRSAWSLKGCREPSRAELRAIEHESELLDAELALVHAECAWYASPNPETAADLVGVLLRLVDVYDLMDQPERAVA